MLRFYFGFLYFCSKHKVVLGHKATNTSKPLNKNHYKIISAEVKGFQVGSGEIQKCMKTIVKTIPNATNLGFWRVPRIVRV